LIDAIMTATDRRTALEAELVQTDEKLKRLYRAIEDGTVELDTQLKDRIRTLKTEGEIAQASLDRIRIQNSSRVAITPAQLEAFSRLMRERLASGDTRARKAYLRSVISYIEVGDDRIRIVGETAALAAIVAGQQNHSNHARGFVRKWRANLISS
jgi:hypothetical protein